MNPSRLLLLLAALALSAGTLAAGAEPHPPRGHFAPPAAPGALFRPGAMIVLPDDGRNLYYDAFAAAKREIRIEICVLEDSLILQRLKQAIDRGVRVRVIVDSGKYAASADERDHLATYVTAAGGELHVSNPIFPRSFPKVILVDDRHAVIGSACLDSTTFKQYRDYAYVSNDRGVIGDLSRLFENDWRHSAKPGATPSTYNPTPPVTQPELVVAPVNAAYRLVTLIQGARRTLDVTSELMGDPTLESELAAAVARGVHVRLIAPEEVNNAGPDIQALQIASLDALKAAGVQVRVTRKPETAEWPYMHARTAVVDGRRGYLGSISLSPDSATYNRGVGLILDEPRFVDRLQDQFEIDFTSKTHAY
jgi:phosphatidylserine/phosphatidylglycerophosphate/cardiolipin synthase-like enzyme